MITKIYLNKEELLFQKYKDYELILVNDNSTDNTPSINASDDFK